ncbi:MAG: long-chain fatty acid--CoA ligase [Alphaproteobacteria bacterium]|nr:long-chain fatty acid--CoA ligase [Alphaproteobacteria bacterium]
MSEIHDASRSTEFDTFPKLLIRNAKVRGNRPASREKQYGIWQTWTWSDVLDEVRAIACGLAAMGMKRGDRLAIIGDNRPQLYWTMVSAQAIGAVPVPLYQDSVAEEMKFVTNHAEVRFAVVEDQEQVDKLIEIKADLPHLEEIVYADTRGMRNYTAPNLHSIEALQEKGRDYHRDHPDFFDAEVAKSNGKDTAIVLYTSGTTGQPKGVILSFDNVVITAQNAVDREGLREDEEVLAYLPMAWVGDNIFSLAQAYCAGFCVSCPESAATVTHDLREIGPTYYFAPPLIYERILTNVMIRMEDASWLKRKTFHYFMGIARRVGTRILDGESVGLVDRLTYALGNILVYGPLKNTLGFSRIRIAYTAGEAIGPDIFDFFRSLGINIKQLYGSTEASVFVTIQPNGEIKPDTVGTPAPDVELKIAENGEVMFRSPGVFQAYYKNEEATRTTKTDDGWVHTGDAGIIGTDGHLKIIDRAKDVGRLNDGTMFAPKFIENKLKFFPNVAEVVAFGDGRDYVAAFINIDLEAVGNWSERSGYSYGSYQELAAKPEVYALIAGHIEQVNGDLAADPQLFGSQVRRFLILHKALDADDGELTRTRKVRRSFIADKYGVLIDALYSDKTHQEIETEVTFEDGRKGVIGADLQIRDVAMVEATPLKKAS